MIPTGYGSGIILDEVKKPDRKKHLDLFISDNGATIRASAEQTPVFNSNANLRGYKRFVWRGSPVPCLVPGLVKLNRNVNQSVIAAWDWLPTFRNKWIESYPVWAGWIFLPIIFLNNYWPKTLFVLGICSAGGYARFGKEIGTTLVYQTNEGQLYNLKNIGEQECISNRLI